VATGLTDKQGIIRGVITVLGVDTGSTGTGSTGMAYGADTTASASDGNWMERGLSWSWRERSIPIIPSPSSTTICAGTLVIRKVSLAI